MPFLEDNGQPIDLSKRIDTPTGFAVTPGANDLEDTGTKPSWNWGAAFRRNNEMAALAASESAWTDNSPEAGFNPWDKIKGTPDEANFKALSEARNSKKFEAIRTDIARENADRKLLDSQPWWMGLVTEGTAGILSPTTLLPGGSFVKGAKGGVAIVKAGASVGVANAIGAAAQESMLQSVEQTRTAGESATAIGASLFLGGLLGAGGQAILSKGEWFRATRDMDREVHLGSSVPGTPITSDLLSGNGVSADVLARHYPGFEAWHGSPHKFDKFDASQIDMGEGSQSQGHGLYFAEQRVVAEQYRDNLSRAIPTVNGRIQATGNGKFNIVDDFGVQAGPFPNREQAELSLKGTEGNLYRVQINADQERFLDWDKPFSGQSEFVRKALSEHADLEGVGAVSGRDLYKQLQADRASPAEVSALLNDSGIHGVKYLDAGSRADGEGSRNFVVFDDKLVQVLDRNGVPLNVDLGSSGGLSSLGAAANTAAGLSSNSIAGRIASGVAASTAQLNPLLRILHSPSAVARQVGTDLFENPLYLKKNFEGVASEPAVETFMKEYNGGLAKALQATADGYPEYRKAGGQLARDEFRDEVGRAMRRGDTNSDPVIDKLAKTYRSSVFDPLFNQAKEVGILKPDIPLETAQSYFSRMWNGRKISADETGFKGMVEDYITQQMPRYLAAFDHETAEKVAKLKDDALREFQVARRIEREDRFEAKDAARQVANEVFDTMTGRAGQGVRPDFITIKARGPLKERTFDIHDLFKSSNGRAVEDYLEHDVEQVARRYTRIMGADVELARKFGSVDMAEQIGKIREDYKALRDGITDEKQLAKLAAREKSDIGDLEAVRDMLRGTNPGSPTETNYSRIVRSVNHFNYLRSMGEVAIASLTETVRPAMVHGLMPYMETLGQTLTNMKGIRASVKEAQIAGVVTERVLGTRLATLSEIIDPYASRGPVEAFLENMTNVASKWNGIRLLTDMQKSIASVMTQNRLLRGASMFQEVAEKERAYLAYLGIDQSMAERIAKQFAEHGETIDKVRVANQEKWTDAVAARTYRAALSKDVDSIITTKGVADTPLFANTPTGRAMLQFKSFALASHQRVLLRGLQEDQSRFVGGIVAMTTIGMMATWLKAISGNRLEKDFSDIQNKPGWLIGEGLDKSGIFAIPMELANTFEKATSFNPIKSPIKAFDEAGSISQKNQNRNKFGSLLGPTIGLGDDILTIAGLPKKMVDGEEVTKAEKSAAERLLPFNSYLGVRQMLRHVINPPQ